MRRVTLPEEKDLSKILLLKDLFIPLDIHESTGGSYVVSA